MKAFKKLKSIVPKNSLVHYGSVVNANKDYLYYTDGHKLLRLKNKYNMEGQYSKDALSGIEYGVNKPNGGCQYPNCEAVIESTNNQAVNLEITLNAKMLTQLLQVLTADSPHKEVTFKFTDSCNPVRVVNEFNEIGILVPINKKRRDNA